METNIEVEIGPALQKVSFMRKSELKLKKKMTTTKTSNNNERIKKKSNKN